MLLSGIADKEPGVEGFVEALRVKARVEDDGGRGVVVRFVASFGGDAALKVTWPRFGRWRTKERRRGAEVAIESYMVRVCLSRYTSVFLKSISVAMDAREAPILFIFFKSISSGLLHLIMIAVNDVHCTLSKPPRSLYLRNSIYFQTKAEIIPSFSIKLGQTKVKSALTVLETSSQRIHA